MSENPGFMDRYGPYAVIAALGLGGTGAFQSTKNSGGEERIIGAIEAKLDDQARRISDLEIESKKLATMMIEYGVEHRFLGLERKGQERIRSSIKPNEYLPEQSPTPPKEDAQDEHAN